MNAWMGGGMTMLRVDRGELARRTAVPDWISDPLLDAFESAAASARKKADDRKDRPGRNNRKD